MKDKKGEMSTATQVIALVGIIIAFIVLTITLGISADILGETQENLAGFVSEYSNLFDNDANLSLIRLNASVNSISLNVPLNSSDRAYSGANQTATLLVNFTLDTTGNATVFVNGNMVGNLSSTNPTVFRNVNQEWLGSNSNVNVSFWRISGAINVSNATIYYWFSNLNSASNSTAFNSTAQGLKAIEELSSWEDTLALVIIAGVIILLIFGYLKYKGGSMGIGGM